MNILSLIIAQLPCRVVDRNGHMMIMSLVARDMMMRSSNGNFHLLVSSQSHVGLVDDSHHRQTQNVRGLNKAASNRLGWR
jgi:hypothetical protein